VTDSSKKLLFADIGGTHARFVLGQADGTQSSPAIWLTSMYPSLSDALRAFIEQQGDVEIAGAAICAAGPVEREEIKLTNCPWRISRNDLAATLSTDAVLLINDFEALAAALPHLAASDLRQLGDTPQTDRRAPKVVVGPGTGLGVAGLVPDLKDSWIPVATEGGHIDLAPANTRELSLYFQLMQEFGHVSAERVLSGPGLESLYTAIAMIDGTDMRAKPSAVDIASRARDNTDPVAIECIELFCGWLGAVAGNLALAYGAKGGIYLAGGILPQWGDLFNEALFRHRFISKGRFRNYLDDIPTALITSKDPAMIGLKHLLGEHMEPL